MVLIGVGLSVHVHHQKVGTEGVAKDLFGQYLSRWAVGYQVSVQAARLVTGAGNTGEVVGAEDHCRAFGSQIPNGVQKLVLGCGVESGQRFVQQLEVWGYRPELALTTHVAVAHLTALQ